MAGAHQLQALHHQSAVQPGERHYIAHGGQCDEIEQQLQIRLGAIGEKAAAAQGTQRCHSRHEGDTSGAQITQTAGAIKPVGIYGSQNSRRWTFGFVVVQHDYISAAVQRR